MSEHDLFPPKIRELMDRLDRVQYDRRSRDLEQGVEWPETTDPESPQSEAESAIIDSLTEPENLLALRAIVRRSENFNPTAKTFFRKLVEIAERRSSGTV